jgi:hypothetical protein
MVKRPPRAGRACAIRAAEVDPVRIGGTVGWMREDLDDWLDRQARRGAALNAYPDAKAAVLAHAQAILARRR